MKAAPDKSHFFLTRVKFLGHIIERNTITSLKSRIDAIQKFQPPSNKKKIQEFLGMLNFLSKYVYKMQLYLRPFYNILRQQNNTILNGQQNIKHDLKKSKLFSQNKYRTQFQIPISHWVYRFQLSWMKFPNLHINWKAGKNLALPDTISKNTPLELLTRKTTVEIPLNIKIFLAKDETSPQLECK